MQRAWSHKVRHGAKRIWNDEAEIKTLIVRAINYGMQHRRMPESLAYDCAHTAVTNVWIECKMGACEANSEDELWGSVVSEINRAKPWHDRKFVSLDEPVSTIEGTLDRHSGGRFGYTLPSQIYTVRLAEVYDAIEALPGEYREIMTALAMGDTAAEIAKAERLPVHVVLRKMNRAREYLGAGV